VQITIWFWIIKVLLCTTVGESAADWLNTGLGVGLGGTTGIMAAGLMITLSAQFCVKKNMLWLYWLNAFLVSVVGTLLTDLLVDQVGVELWVCIIVFSVLMIGTFAAWYHSEKTLSIHSINAIKQELFYWCAILFTFGTALGDYIAEGLALGRHVKFGSLENLVQHRTVLSTRGVASPKVYSLGLAQRPVKPRAQQEVEYLCPR
jgi:uncharacterized membrane-anchored protein